MQELKNKRIALIGGAGFIGHNLALALKRAGAEVCVVDGLQVNNLLSFSSPAGNDRNRDLYLRILSDRLNLLRENGIALHPQDARDYHALARILDASKAQIFVQMAAVAHAGKANKDPFSTFDHSLRTLENALDCARNKVERFVFFSSSMVYGNFKTPEVTEESPLNPLGIYGALKLAGEKIVEAYHQVFGLPYTIVRPSALYGPRCVSRRVVQIFIESALRGEKIKVDGDGQERLDFTYIDDFVQGLMLVLAKKEALNQTFNITYGASRSILELVEALRKCFPEIEVENTPRDNLMPFRGTLSIQKAKNLLGFDPQNPIEVAVEKYVRWYQSLSHDWKKPH